MYYALTAEKELHEISYVENGAEIISSLLKNAPATLVENKTENDKMCYTCFLLDSLNQFLEEVELHEQALNIASSTLNNTNIKHGELHTRKLNSVERAQLRFLNEEEISRMGDYVRDTYGLSVYRREFSNITVLSREY